MEISEFLKKWKIGEGRTRIINDEGKVIFEIYDPYGGTSVDWVSAEWIIKEGVELKYEYSNLSLLIKF
jgi:hypothetical protein